MEAPLALYRRYRPDTFAEVIGQDHVTGPLRNALTNNRVNHAYLFSGPRGCGKTTSARILARAINCEKGPIAEPCGECQSCTDLARGGPGSIDVIEIDAASHGGVDDARDLRERAFFSPVQSRYKIYIIDEAHMVTTQGFNALLKLVEEPPPHLKFIFATTEPDKVIGTIRSRTHHYPFRLVPPKVLADYMAQLCAAEDIAIEPAALPLVVRAGAGSVRDSLSVLDQLIGGAGPDGVTYALAVALLGFTPDSLLDACVDGFAAHDSAAVFEVIDKVIETGQDPKRFAEDLLRRLRDLVILSAVPTAVASGLIDVAEDQGDRLQTQAAGLGAAELTRAADIVAAGLLEMRGATAPRLQLELICAKVLLPGADDSTNGIQARLDRIERRITLGLPAAAEPADTGTAVGVAPDQAASRVAARQAAQGGSGSSAALGRGDSAPVAGSAPAGAIPHAGPVAGTPADAVADTRADAVAGRPAPSTRPAAQSAAAQSAAGQSASGQPGADQSPAGQPAVGQSGAGRSATGEAVADQPAASAGSAARQAAAAQPGAQAAPSGGSTGGAAAGGAAGGIGLADLRRLWPDILQRVKERKKVSWMMLSQNAQVLAIDDKTITIGLSHAGVRENFVRSGHDEILREAVRDAIMLDRRIDAVVDPSTNPSGASAAPSAPTSAAPSAPASAAPSAPASAAAPAATPPTSTAPATSQPSRTGAWDELPTAAEPSAGPGSAAPAGQAPDQPGPNRSGVNQSGPGAGGSHQSAAPQQSPASPGPAHPGGDQASAPSGQPSADAAEERRDQSANRRRAAEAAFAAEQARRAQTAQAAPEKPLTPEEEADAVGEDDLVLEEDSRSQTDLLRETLGAQIIDEQPN